MSRGRGALALGGSLCLVAGAFGTAALYVPGAALMIIVSGAAATVRIAAWRATVTRTPERARVEEGAPVRFSVRVAGCGRRFGAGELVGWPSAPPRPLRSAPHGSIGFTARPRRRGAHVLGPAVVRFRDPFGVCARAVRSAPGEVLVLPRVERISSVELARLAGSARGARTNIGDPPGIDVDGLRPYRPGAPASRIHWPTVARSGTLVERRLDTERERAPLVVLDARRPASEDALDMAVRAAASLCVGLAKLGGCALLLPDDRHAHRLGADLAGWPALHERLALVQPGGAPPRLASEHAGVVFWVSAGARADAASARRVTAATLTVSPLRVAERPVLFTVAGCAVQPTAGNAARAA